MKTNDREATYERIREVLKKSGDQLRKSRSSNGNKSDGVVIDPVLREWDEIVGEVETLTGSEA